MGFLFKAPKVQANNVTKASALNIQSSAYGLTLPLIYGATRVSGNIIWYGDFTSIEHVTSVGGGAGKGGGLFGGGGQQTTYTYSASFAIGLCEGQISSVNNVYIDKEVKSASSMGLSVFTGSYPQSPWGYLTSKHSSEALGYSGIAYIGVANYDLGGSAVLPNFNFEVNGKFYGQSANGRDAIPTNVIVDLLTNDKYGCGFPNLYDFTIYDNYVRALDLGISPCYNTQKTCASILQEIMINTNSEFVWSSGKLTIIPYGDTNLTGNGRTYIAPSAPLYSLNDDDFINNSNDNGPVILTRKRQADIINNIKMECFDRNNSYNPSIVEAKDQSLIDQFGIRSDSSRQGHIFCDLNTAKLSVQLQLQREQVVNTYVFTTSQRYILLDPMDIISITDSTLGIVNQWVRIIEIHEDSSGNLTFTCEEYLNGNGHAPLYDFQDGNGFVADYNASAGNINQPIIFEAPVQLSKSGLEVWVAASGGSNYGGCLVYVSTDGNTYKYAGKIQGRSRQGVLTSTFPSGSNPDVTNICSVDLSLSYGQLLSGTELDASLNHTLCYVDDELISYQTATLTGSSRYNLETYITRGQYGTTIKSHPIGSKFVRIDDNILRYTYLKEQIGKPFYVKFLSFNQYGGGTQQLSDVSPYTRVIVGPPPPPNVKNFSAQQKGGSVVFNWDEVSDYALKGYDILYGSQGGNIEDALFLTEAMRGTEMTNASVPPGTWTFYIRAVDIAGQFSPVPASYDLIIVYDNPIISQIAQQPDWSGTLYNLVRHYSGVLIPTGKKTCDQYIQILSPSQPILSYIVGGNINGTIYYVTLTYISGTGETLVSDESYIFVPTNNLLKVKSPTGGSNISSYNIYIGINSGNGTLQNLSPQAIGVDWVMPITGIINGRQKPIRNTTGWDVFDVFVPDVNNVVYYIAPTIDTGYNDNLRAFCTFTASKGYGQSGATNVQYSINTWLTLEEDTNVFTDWVIGFITMRYIRNKITLSITDGSVPYITEFTPILDTAPSIQSSASVNVSIGGTFVEFSTRYHSAPFVQITVIATTALIGTATEVTPTGFTAHVWNSSGVDVGGIINWTATGE